MEKSLVAEAPRIYCDASAPVQTRSLPPAIDKQMPRKAQKKPAPSLKKKRRFQRRARQSEDKTKLRQKFIDIAREKFAVQAIEEVSLSSIAAEAGYSKGTLYQYFPSRIALLIAVKGKNFEEIVDKMLSIAARTPDAQQRLAKILDAYVKYWATHPSHFKSLFSMSGTIEDRRLPDGTLFGESPVAVKAFGVFIDSVADFFKSRGAKPDQALLRLLTSSLLAAVHGAVSLPFGTPSMKWPELRVMAQISVSAILHSWELRLVRAKKTSSWPRLEKKLFL